MPVSKIGMMLLRAAEAEDRTAYINRRGDVVVHDRPTPVGVAAIMRTVELWIVRRKRRGDWMKE